MQSYRPSSNTFQYSPVKGRSVPAFCVTSYCTGVSSYFSTSAEGFTKDCSLISTPFQVDNCASDGVTVQNAGEDIVEFVEADVVSDGVESGWLQI